MVEIRGSVWSMLKKPFRNWSKWVASHASANLILERVLTRVLETVELVGDAPGKRRGYGHL